MSSFMQRTLSILFLAPLVLLVFWVGGFLLKAFAALVMLVAFYEFFMIAKLERQLGVKYGLTAFAAVYCAVAFIALISLPLSMLLFLVLAVWGSDIGGYVFGKIIGGPKLVPKISPNKTIAGLVGACLVPSFVMGCYLFPYYNSALIAGVMIGIIGQIGDVSISYLKRRVNIKDTGNIIPGHGGVLDRVDALMLVIVVFWVLTEFKVVLWP
jgi:phosphatidate cytidylyltransferase